MEFYTSFSEKRPIRLSEATRRFAYESLYEHRYGQESRQNSVPTMDHIEGYADLSPIERYDLAIEAIAREAPIRICDGERISGAASLYQGHVLPATYQGKPVFSSVSHLTLDFPKVLRKGLYGIRREVESSRACHTDPRQLRFLESCERCLDAFARWHGRYIDALVARGYVEQAELLNQVPMNPPTSFHEAVQSLWFVFAFCRLCGNWPGIGRIDEMLGPYLKVDLATGALTLDEAREILAHFFIKGCEWIDGSVCGTGDAQNYQNLVLAGIDEEGNEVTNEVTYLVLDIIEELGISDFPTTVRVNAATDPRLLRRVAEVMRYGNGVLAIYNEPLILKALAAYGYDPIEARRFANDGCWEVQIPGRTYFCYYPFDSLWVLQTKTLGGYTSACEASSFEELYARYLSDLRATIKTLCDSRLPLFERVGDAWQWRPALPCTVISLFEEDCIGRAASYFEGGAVYNVMSPHIGGLADTVNSLYAIKKCVFEEGKVTLSELMVALSEDWEGNEPLRRYLRDGYEYYGNDNDEVDALATQLLSDFADICAEFDGSCPIAFPPGVSTFGRQVEWLPQRLASPHGRRKGEILAANLSPTPGTPTKGATAIIKSHCKADLSRQTTGSALDIRLLPNDVKGERGVTTLVALIQSFVALGGYFMQIDVADSAILREAQEHPEDYPSLAVRVSGWNARFVTLSREWQNMVIESIENRS